MIGSSLHRPPRYPHAWAWLFGASQGAVLLAGWHWGWVWVVAGVLVTHGLMFWATLRPDSWLFSPVLTRVPGSGRSVWLTIDDGPSDDTAKMLDLLERHAAKATFFLVGERAAARPDLVRAIVTRGHDIGNHSNSHPSHWFWALPPSRMHAEIAGAQATLTAVSGRAPRWFRAVVGMANPFVAAALRRQGLARVAWSARGFDGVEAVPERVVARIEQRLAPGAIVVLHEGAAHGRNVDMLALLLRRLDALGYRCVVPESCGSGTTSAAVAYAPDAYDQA